MREAGHKLKVNWITSPGRRKAAAVSSVGGPSRPTFLRATIDRVESLKNWVRGAGSSATVDGSLSSVIRSKRFDGLGVTPARVASEVVSFGVASLISVIVRHIVSGGTLKRTRPSSGNETDQGPDCSAES